MLLPGDFGRTLLRPGLLLQLQLPLANVRHGPDGRRVEEGVRGQRPQGLPEGARQRGVSLRFRDPAHKQRL